MEGGGKREEKIKNEIPNQVRNDGKRMTEVGGRGGGATAGFMHALRAGFPTRLR